MYISHMLLRRRMLAERLPYSGTRWAVYPLTAGETLNGVSLPDGMYCACADDILLTRENGIPAFDVGSNVPDSADGMYSVSCSAGGVRSGTVLYGWSADEAGTYTVSSYTLGPRSVITGSENAYPDNGISSGSVYVKL